MKFLFVLFFLIGVAVCMPGGGVQHVSPKGIGPALGNAVGGLLTGVGNTVDGLLTGVTKGLSGTLKGVGELVGGKAYDHHHFFRKAEGLRYEYILGENGSPHLLDRWLKHSDLVQLLRYDPDRDNQYHLFTRKNPTVSQLIVWGNIDVLRQSNFNPGKKTAVVIHGYGGNVTTSSNSVLIPAFLAAADVNVIAVDWSVGAVAPTLAEAFRNVMLSGRSAAGFLNWLLSATGQTALDLHINGFSLGGHHAGITGRYVNGNVSFVTALDPTRSEGSEHEFRADDGAYTEVINTNVNAMGYRPLGQVDFYPNGGQHMPGCGPGDVSCNHSRAYFFIAESLKSGGFTGRQCESYQHAKNGTCNLPGKLQMGGLTPKTGKTGAYYLETNSASPFSKS